jgi:hypothetical protein
MALNNFLERGSENRFHKGGSRQFMLLFVAFNLSLIACSVLAPLGDFGNYYYGSRFFVSGIDPLRMYEDIHDFNVLIRPFESGPFFENYTPVPPFSLLFYIPFLVFSCFWAKVAFNIVSLVLLSFSLWRAMRHSGFINYRLYLLPLIFFQSLLSNYQQGQAYLLIAAGLLELFISWQNRQAVRSGLILALLFSLKIFPVFIVIFFVLKRDWKPVAWFLLFSLVLAGITCTAVGISTCLFYVADVLPKLAANEITSPFAASNQSFHSLLMRAFIYDRHQNPFPFVALPPAALVLETLFCACVLVHMAGAGKKDPALFFFTCLLSLLLINKYTTVYGLFILFPLVLLVDKIKPRQFLWTCLLLALALNLPVHRLSGFPLILQYARFWLLLLAGICLAQEIKPTWNWKMAFAALVLSFLSALVFYAYKSPGEHRIYPSAGVLYDISAGKKGLHLFSCLGHRDTVEVWPISVHNVDSASVRIQGSGIIKNGSLVYSGGGRIKKALLLNGHYLIALSDKNNGAGMYHLLIKDLGQ